MRLDIHDHMLSQEDINRRIGKKPLAYPGLKTTISANAWLSMWGSLWGPRIDQYISVQLGLGNVN